MVGKAGMFVRDCGGAFWQGVASSRFGAPARMGKGASTKDLLILQTVRHSD